MESWLWVVAVLPFAGFLTLALAGKRFDRHTVAFIGAGSVTAAAAIALAIGASFALSPPEGSAYRQTLWEWMTSGSLAIDIGLRLDPLAVVMMLVVTVVGALIHLYAAEFMRDDPGYARFFASMNLFVGSMLALVLADNLVLLYLGWEGVGLCSYLLIGFWYQDPANGRAAQKAFIVTRVGDAAMAVGLFLLFTELGTLEIQDVIERAAATWPKGHGHAALAAALLLGGALGKSAQLPVQTWLPDAMAGPTPVSALIHAATMVTAGVYLIARMHPLFELAPGVLFAVAVIGALTLLVAGFSALVQRDIKRVLAYSTVSQIGLMFLALGVGAWAAAIFHLMTHAFFKALLFLSAGAVTHAVHHEHDITKMGGLRRELPVAWWGFVAGGASLAGVPLVTAGFYSKELVLWQTFVSHPGGYVLWAAGIAGAFLTSLYIFRLVFLVFLGPAKTHVDHRPGTPMRVALVVLSALALVGGFVEIPGTLGGVDLFSRFLAPVLPGPPGAHGDLAAELALQLLAAALALFGIYLAYRLFARRPRTTEAAYEVPLLTPGLRRFLHSGFGFDALYDLVFVRPYRFVARAGAADLLDAPFRGLAALLIAAHRAFTWTQSGKLRWYAGAIVAGAVLALLAGVLS